MKKIIIVVTSILVTIGLNAQNYKNDKFNDPNALKPDSTLYDTLVVFNPIANYITSDDEVAFSWTDSTIEEFWSTYPDSSSGYDIGGYPNGVGPYEYRIYEPDTVVIRHTVHYNRVFPTRKWFYLKDKDTITKVMNNNNIIAYQEEFAQPWHLDSFAVICGVYVDMRRKDIAFDNDWEYFYLLDNEMNVLDSSQEVSLDGGGIMYPDGTVKYPNGTEFHHFYFHRHDIKLKDFYISAGAKLSEFYGHAFSIYEPDTAKQNFYKQAGYPYNNKIYLGIIPKDRDGLECAIQSQADQITKGYTIITNANASRKNMYLLPYCVGTANTGIAGIDPYADHPITDSVQLCDSPYSPLIKRNGEWISFADDSLYYLHQKMILKFLPIILVPKSESALKQPDSVLEANVWVSPNPASDLVKITSGFILNKIEIYNTSGVKVFEDNTRSNQQQINISSFDKGAYIVKLYTPRGTVSRKIIKQ